MAGRRGVWVIVLLITLVGAAVFTAALALRGPRHQRPAAPAVLVWNVPDDLIEGEPPRRLFGYGWLHRTQPTVLDAVRTLDRAATDHRVKALVLHIDGVSWGWGKLSEIRDAVARVRRFKPVFAMVESGGDAEYFLASAAQVVAIPPAAVLRVDGLMASAMFFRGAFDKLDVHPNFAHAGAFKSAAESYTRGDMSPAARQALTALVDDLYSMLADSLASARGLAPDSARRLIDEGPFEAPRALATGLVDTLAYTDQLDSLALHHSGDDAEILSFSRYMDRAPWSDSHVAFVTAVGGISAGRSRFEPFGGVVMGSETVTETLRELRDDHSVKAVVLRVDSPGGDAQAADDMWHEVELLNQVKPVIVSMSDLAASGGYYIAAPATRIVAQPGTLTGSIGVFGGKLNVLGLYRKLGLNVETVSRGKNAEMLSPIRDFDADEGARFQAQIDTTYQLFLRRVSAGRSMPIAEADSAGQGRVWTGEAALAHGLVDTLGGIRTAWRLALESADLPVGQQLSIQEYPRIAPTFLDRLMRAWLSDEQPEDDMASRSFTPVMRAWLQAAAFPAGRMLALVPWSITVR